MSCVNNRDNGVNECSVNVNVGACVVRLVLILLFSCVTDLMEGGVKTGSTADE